MLESVLSAVNSPLGKARCEKYNAHRAVVFVKLYDEKLNLSQIIKS